MVFIQLLIIVFAALVVLKIISSFQKKEISFKMLVFWLSLWLMILIVVLLPQTTALLAKMLGVWRGTDVMIYLSVVMIFYLLFRIFVKLEKIESNITVIVRKIALNNKEEDRK